VDVEVRPVAHESHEHRAEDDLSPPRLQRPPDDDVRDAVRPGEIQQRGGGVGRLQADDLRALPVVMLSARAGEEASVEGLDAGADDYLTKPFSARELFARVRANLEMARMRRDASQRGSDQAADARHRPNARTAGLTALRANPDAFSFPSGHSAAAFAVASLFLAGHALAAPGVQVADAAVPPVTINNVLTCGCADGATPTVSAAGRVTCAKGLGTYAPVYPFNGNKPKPGEAYRASVAREITSDFGRIF